MTSPISSSLTSRAVGAAHLVGRQWTTRVLSELDDNGPLPRDAVSSAFPDIPPHSLRYALSALRHRGLLTVGEEEGPASYLLTEAGADLGDVHDALFRWARTHHYPTRESDFVTRVEAGLALLKNPQTHAALTTPGDSRRPDAPTAQSADQLHALTEAGLIEKDGSGERQLTAAGEELRGPFTALTSWADRYAHLVAAAPLPGRPALRTTLPDPRAQHTTAASPAPQASAQRSA